MRGDRSGSAKTYWFRSRARRRRASSRAPYDAVVLARGQTQIRETVLDLPQAAQHRFAEAQCEGRGDDIDENRVSDAGRHRSIDLRILLRIESEQNIGRCGKRRARSCNA